jgi:hypothetical protein
VVSSPDRFDIDGSSDPLYICFINIKQQIIMKTTTIILAAIFTLQASFLFAGNESVTSTSTPVEITLDIAALVPVTPAEATFEDVVPVIDLGSLAPVVPVEADFSDTVDQTIDISSLAPVTPMVADFE